MSDPNLVAFYGRIARIERARTKGYGFEAPGTLGRSYSLPPKHRRNPTLRIVVLVAICAFGLKAAIHHTVGPDTYQQRVADLQTGEGFDRLGGWLMQADPVTVWLSGQITEVKARLQ